MNKQKQDLERTMSELGKPFLKNKIQKIEKTETPKWNCRMWTKKPLASQRIFVQTPFSHSTLKLERKKFHVAKPLAFSLHFLFRRDQNHYSNLTSKIMKMCEKIFKKKDSAHYNSNSSSSK